MNIIEELKWRGLVQDIIPGTEEQLLKEMTTGYVGFDPTSDSLHIGSLVPILLLMHLQRAGHRPIALVGGATGMVGDPSGKSEERNMLPLEQLELNIIGIRNQLSKFLDFDESKKNAAILVNNFDWFKDFTFLDFIREVGKFITVNYMLAKDSVQKRLESGMSFTEFSYQLVQGFDFYYLNNKYGVKLQMGGSDQWGNIVTGTELIRKKSGGEAFAFTAPLLKKADGGKFGKTESGNIWIDASKTSPYKFYQFWSQVSDEDAENYIKIFTFIPPAEIDALIEEHRANLGSKLVQKRLAKELTIMVHSEEEHDFAVQASSILFGDDTSEALKALDENQLLEILDGVDRYEISKQKFNEGYNLLNLVVETGIFPSKTEARKMIVQGGVRINKVKEQNPDFNITDTNLLKEKYILIQKGKKKHNLIIIA